MIPWLLVAELISRSGKKLSELVGERVDRFPVSGEINRGVSNVKSTLLAIESRYLGQALQADFTDGVSLDLGEWRFNLRPSSTEPLLRLNVESRGDRRLTRVRTSELLALIDGMS